MYENRLVSLAAQKFVSDVANDALQHCKMRSAGQTIKNSKNKDRKFVMTMEDLGQALGNQGVTVKKPPYYTWINYPFVEEYPPVSLFGEIECYNSFGRWNNWKEQKIQKRKPGTCIGF